MGELEEMLGRGGLARYQELKDENQALRAELKATDDDKGRLALRLSEAQDEIASLREQLEGREPAAWSQGGPDAVITSRAYLESLREQLEEARRPCYPLCVYCRGTFTPPKEKEQ